MPVLSFAIVVAPPGPGQGSAWSVVERAASGRSPARPCYPIPAGTVGPSATTERIWHRSRCPVCNRAVTNADACRVQTLTLGRRLRVKHNTQKAAGPSIMVVHQLGESDFKRSQRRKLGAGRWVGD